MTAAEAIIRACEKAEKFDEACRLENQQNELCAWLEELKAYRETGLTPGEIVALAREVDIWKSSYYDLLKTAQNGISMIYETLRMIPDAHKQESETKRTK